MTQNIADTMAYLQGEGRLLRGEHNHLCEAFLVMASSAGYLAAKPLCLKVVLVLLLSQVVFFFCFHRIQQQQEVLAWLLEPLNKMWTQVEWQTAYLSDPSGLTNMFADSQFMWSIYHTVTFFEKALKRSGTKKSSAALQAPTTTVPGYLHPMSSHLAWIVPPLLRVCLALIVN
jgi:exportin-5